MDISLPEAREYEHCAQLERQWLAQMRAAVVNDEEVLPSISAHEGDKDKAADKRAVVHHLARAGRRAQLLMRWSRSVRNTEAALKKWADADNAQRGAEKSEPRPPTGHDAASGGRLLALDRLPPVEAFAPRESRHPDLNRGPTVYELAGPDEVDIPGTSSIDVDLFCESETVLVPQEWSTGRPR